MSNYYSENDPSVEDTQPVKLQQQPTMPVYVPPAVPEKPKSKKRSKQKNKKSGCGCLGFVLLALPVLAILVFYFLFPARTNLLLLGIDRAPEGTDVSRTDTNILLSINPLQPVVNMLSIPRDLWVNIPNVGENRINTAHFFAEANQTGSGPYAAMQTVRQNFGVTVDYYARIRFNGIEEIVNAMGGVTLELSEPMSGYEAGTQHLNGEQALAFVRDRAGTDDFFRMQRGQMMITAMIKEMINPLHWGKIPAVLGAAFDTIDTDIPLWQMPRLGFALVRGVIGGSLDARTITREMTTPFTTNEGASVLLPNWQAINPVLLELFGE
jgi:LCP family protein required for cell wall assembly